MRSNFCEVLIHSLVQNLQDADHPAHDNSISSDRFFESRISIEIRMNHKTIEKTIRPVPLLNNVVRMTKMSYYPIVLTYFKCNLIGRGKMKKVNTSSSLITKSR